MNKVAKVALITGASRGIGRATARLLAKAGYRVAVNYLNSPDQARVLEEELIAQGADVMTVRADVADHEQAADMVRRVEARWRHIDVLVNNAAIAQQKLFTDITEEEWRRMFQVNVDGAYHCARAVIPGMVSRKSGAIVNISSMWGQVGASCEVHYSAAKAAIIGMTKGLAKELGPSGIRVNCVAPGVILTDMNAALDETTLDALREETPLGVLGRPEDVAKAVLFLAGEDASFITGQVLGVNGGLII